MSMNFSKHKFIQKKVICDIYFNDSDLTSLRWLSEVKRTINPLESVFTVSYIKSSLNCIVINKKYISLHDLKRVIFELTIELSEEVNEIEKSITSI